MLALPVLAVMLAPPLPAAESRLTGRRSLGCKASSSGVSITTPLPLTLLASGRSLGSLRLELAQPTCFNKLDQSQVEQWAGRAVIRREHDDSDAGMNLVRNTGDDL